MRSGVIILLYVCMNRYQIKNSFVIGIFCVLHESYMYVYAMILPYLLHVIVSLGYKFYMYIHFIPLMAGDAAYMYVLLNFFTIAFIDLKTRLLVILMEILFVVFEYSKFEHPLFDFPNLLLWAWLVQQESLTPPRHLVPPQGPMNVPHITVLLLMSVTLYLQGMLH